MKKEIINCKPLTNKNNSVSFIKLQSSRDLLNKLLLIRFDSLIGGIGMCSNNLNILRQLFILIFISIMILNMPSLAYSQTVVSGNVTGVWSLAGSPYLVSGDIEIVDSLIIESGVVVQFNAGGYRIRAASGDKFVAIGTETEPIIFEPFIGTNPGSWSMLYFDVSSNDDTLSYCIIQNAVDGINTNNSHPVVINSTIRYNSSYGINSYDSDITIDSCSIYGNVVHGIYLNNYHNYNEARVTNSELFDNGDSGIRFTGYARYGNMSASCIIDNCTIYRNTNNGILVTSGTYYTSYSAVGLAHISNCTIYGNTNGVIASAYRGNALATIVNSIISFNTGYGVYNNDVASHINAGEISYNCMWSNSLGDFSGIDGVPTGFGTNGNYQNGNGDSCDVYLNIYNDPQFIDTTLADFRLLESSKCIDAGTSIVNGNFITDPDGSLPDIGFGQHIIQPITVVSGNVTGVWSLAGSPYLVSGDIEIVDSLIIESGVVVQFNAGGYRIRAASGDKFVAIGTETEPIIFEPFIGTNPGSWSMLYFDVSSNDDTLSYCIIQNAVDGINTNNSHPVVINSTIRYNSSYGINSYDSDITIDSCSIYGNVVHGIYLNNYHNYNEARVTNSELFDNGDSGIRFTGYARYGNMSASCIIDNCTIYRNTNNGILVTSGTYYTSYSAVGLAHISNCTIYGNTNGVIASAYRGNALATIVNSIISFNTGYGVYNNDVASHINAGEISYNCMWSNSLGDFSGIDGVPTGFGTNGNYQNGNGDSCDVYLNIYNDPQFIDTTLADFRLLESSKCIDAGTSIVNGNFITDPDGSLPDIGSSYFNHFEVKISCFLFDQLIEVCEIPTEISIPLRITNETNVIINGTNYTTWDDTLSFFADTSGEYTFNLLAYNDSTADTCNILINISQNIPIELSLSDLSFTTTDTSNQVPPSQVVYVTSICDTGSVYWDVDVINGSDWISIDKSTGTNPDSLAISIIDKGSPYDAGVYAGKIKFTDQSGANPARYVDVSLFVESGVIIHDHYISAGSSLKVPIKLHANQQLLGFSIPLRYSTFQPGEVIIDSVIFDTSYVDTAFIIPDSQMIIVDRDIQPPPLPDSQVSAEIAYMYFTITDQAVDEIVVIDTTTINWNGLDYTYQFVYATGDTVIPLFNDGRIIIGDVDDPIYCNVRGDIDHSGDIDIADLVYYVSYSFQGGLDPVNFDEADLNADNEHDISDIVYLVSYMFNNGPAPIHCSLNAKRVVTSSLTEDIIVSSSYTDDETIISINSGQNIKGIQIELYGAGVSDPENLLSETLDLVYGWSHKNLKVGLLDLDGPEIIKAGNHSIIKLQGTFEIVSARVADMDANSITPLIKQSDKLTLLPEEFTLSQNYPNPFNPATMIKFSIPVNTDVNLEIFNVLGQRVVTLVDQPLEAGVYEIEWDSKGGSGQDVASGVYFYRIKTDNYTEAKKMVLLK